MSKVPAAPLPEPAKPVRMTMSAARGWVQAWRANPDQAKTARFATDGTVGDSRATIKLIDVLCPAGIGLMAVFRYAPQGSTQAGDEAAYGYFAYLIGPTEWRLVPEAIIPYRSRPGQGGDLTAEAAVLECVRRFICP